MSKRFFYAFHNKIITFVIAVVTFLMISFIAYQIIYGNIRSSKVIEKSLEESSKKFQLFLNTKLDFSDKIVKTLMSDKELRLAINILDKKAINERLNFFEPIFETIQIEIIDSLRNYYSSNNIDSNKLINNGTIDEIIKASSTDGSVFFHDDNNGLDIRYIIKDSITNDIVSAGLTISNDSYIINYLKNLIGSDILIISKKNAFTTTFPNKEIILTEKDLINLDEIRNELKKKDLVIKELNINKTLYSIQFQYLTLERGATNTIIGFAINKSDLVDSINSAVLITAISSILVFIFVALFSYYFTVRMAKPLRMLTHASRRNANGEIITVDYIGNNEISELISNYNSMILELKDKRDFLDFKIKERTIELDKSNHELKCVYNKSIMELDIAKRVHSLLSHEDKAESEVMETNNMYIPIETEGAIQYNFYRVTDSKVGLLIFNLSRINLSNALLSSLIRLSFSKYSKKNISIIEIFNSVNEELREYIPEDNGGICLFYALIDAENKSFSYINATCSSIFLQKKEGKLIHLNENEYKIGKDVENHFEECEISLDQHDRLIYISDSCANPNLINSIIEKNNCNTSRKMINDILEQNKTDNNYITSILTSDFVFIKRECVIPPDINKIKERILSELNASSDYETILSHKAFIKAIEAFEIGKYDVTIREINRLCGRYTEAIDTFSSLDILAHCYYRLESFEEALIYWELANTNDEKPYCIDKNIAILKGIIEEKKMRKK